MTAVLPSRRIGFEKELSSKRRGRWLHFRLPHDCEQVVEYFLERGSNVDSKDKLGRTLLHHASFYNCIGTVRLFLERGANPIVQDVFGQTPLHVALFRNGKTGIFDILLEAGADPNIKDNNDETILHAAARTGFYQGINDMIKYSSVDLKARNHEGNTALHLAVWAADRVFNYKFDTIMALCKAGSDPYIRNDFDQSAWDMANAYDEYNASSDFSWLVEYVERAGFYDAFCDESCSDSRRKKRKFDFGED
ncbi:uncharacterized protein N7483_011828 [Penicillium malachiteum]|uniref:uncharacterized protein n=1 Tax=Penicillium malachiteum TaxID=1324776 RepID=UPI0025488375|nr:uncharacterized protein N7483_011828 [Penicillium malachiteum]KAJ5714647.1 hypothetical protein N7483_011828 [Penicillium malachiteum]